MLMRAHNANGEPARAPMAYQRLQATLAAVGIDPAAATASCTWRSCGELQPGI
jgi:hypothetical protein